MMSFFLCLVVLLTFSNLSFFSGLVDAVGHLHVRKIYHGHLNEMESYVFCGRQLKIFNARGSLNGLKETDSYQLQTDSFTTVSTHSVFMIVL